MARRNLDELKVGAFISMGILLIMVIVFAVGSSSRMFQRQYRLYSNFKDISGLRTGAPVQLAGLRIGHVEDIRLSSDLSKKEITVVLSIQKKFQDRIRSNSVASIETQGLLGDKFVFVSMGNDPQIVIPDGGILPSKETTSIFALAERAGEIMDNIGDASHTINEMLSSVKGKKGSGEIKAIISSIRNSVEQIEKGKGLVHALIYDSNGQDVVTNLSLVMKSINGILADADKTSKDKLGGMIGNLRVASSDLKDILAMIKNGDGTIGRLVVDPSLYENVSSMFGTAGRNRLLRAVIRSTMKENDKRLLK